MKPTGRALATLAVGVAVGAGVSIPVTALAQGTEGPGNAAQAQVVDNGHFMMGEGTDSMMSMMRGRSGAGDGPPRQDMEEMTRVCAQMMQQSGMQRMHDRMMDDRPGMNQMRDHMMGGMYASSMPQRCTLSERTV